MLGFCVRSWIVIAETPVQQNGLNGCVRHDDLESVLGGGCLGNLNFARPKLRNQIARSPPKRRVASELIIHDERLHPAAAFSLFQNGIPHWPHPVYGEG